MKRKKVLTKSEYIDFVQAHNNRTNVYTTVYDFSEFAERTSIDSSVILNRIFLDFDAHDDESLSVAFEDMKIVMQKIIEEDLMHTLFFSGRGFHLFIEGERTDYIRNIQAYFRSIKEHLKRNGGGSSLDDRVGQSSRLRRVPNTVNMASDDGEGNPYYCIPLCLDDLSLDLEELLNLARSPRRLSYTKTGTQKVFFPEQPPIEMVEGEISVPKHDGKLPILPCLHSATTVENPGHQARVYLIQWYRDILTGVKGIRLTGEQSRPIVEKIMNEIESVYGESEDIWLDWNRRETLKHVNYIVRNNRFSPTCKTLISNGYCVGKCWRFPNGKK